MLLPSDTGRGPRNKINAPTTGVLRRAAAWFAARAVIVRRVLTDNGGWYRSRAA